MVVDGVQRHVFVTASGDSNDIKVVDFDGNIVSTITGEPGASAMVIHDATLYVLLSGADQIDRIDLATLGSLGKLNVPFSMVRGQLAWAGDRLWVSVGDCTDTVAHEVVSLAPDNGMVTRYPQGFFTTECPSFATSRFDPSMLVVIAGRSQLAVPDVGIYRVTVAGPVQIARDQQFGGVEASVAVALDGNELLVPDGFLVRGYSIDTLARTDTVYRATGSVEGISVTPFGGIIASSSRGEPGQSDIWDFHHGSQDPVAQVDAGSAPVLSDTSRVQSSIYPGGVAVSGGARLVFAVTGYVVPNDLRDAWFFVWRPLPGT
jgi:DNA-binding beta-propeller fold protein YncE